MDASYHKQNTRPNQEYEKLLRTTFSPKTVNHLVSYSEVSIIQPLPSVSACKNHLVIVWTIQLSSDENRHKAA